MKPTETDSFPRVTARDLLMVLRVFERTPNTSLENIRLRICVDRKKQRRGTALWSAARDNSTELIRLGLAKGSVQAKNSQQYETMKDNRVEITEDGQLLLQKFKSSRGEAYDDLFGLLVLRHPYLRSFVSVILTKNLFAPVITSMREHVSERYSASSVLASDIVSGSFATDELLSLLEARLKRQLTNTEGNEISDATEQLLRDARDSAAHEDTTRFAKSILNKLNDLVIPALFRGDGLGFDFRTHRTIWTIGQEFRIWAYTRSHPDFDGWLVYMTSSIELNDDKTAVQGLSFDHGLENTRNEFLKKLYEAYQKLQEIRGSTFVSAGELRSVFCVNNCCQPTVFNQLFSEKYTGSDDYKLHLEIQRQKPQHEKPVRAGKRNIGTVRVARR